MLIVAVAFAAGCKKDSAEPNNGGNGGGNGGGGSSLTEEGIYLGVIGFNDNLYTKEIGLLNNSTTNDYKTFINNLTAANGTALYYADYVALDKLKSSQEPPKLTNVVLVTFTDGLDNVSIGPSLPNPGNYNTDEEYRNALHNKIKNDIVHGKHINAYTIGLKGLDAQADLATFRANLKKLASDDNNVYEADNMNQALESFAEIAESLHSVSTTSKLMLKIPGGYNSGIQIRFTFDNVTSVENSNLYIEATYTKNASGLVLNNISYHGFKNGATSLASVGVEGSYYKIVFENLTKNNGDILSQTDINRIKLWKNNSTNWVPETEFTPNGSTQVIEEQSSALIMLVLDCTTSLGVNDFDSMKTAAKEFVETLIASNGGSGATIPTVTTSDVTDVREKSATCGGNVTSDGGVSVTERGICWSTSPNPTINSNILASGSGTGGFTATLSNILTANTTYYVRAYAKNRLGVAYGEQKSFKTGKWLEYVHENDHYWGLTNGGEDEWAVMFPSSVVSQYTGSITKVSACCGMSGNYTLKIYKGGTSQPTTLLKSQSFNAESSGWQLITLSTPLTLPSNTSLWVSICCYYSSGAYPCGSGPGINNKNARWKHASNGDWYDVYDYNGNVDLCWSICTLITSGVKGEEGREILLPMTHGNDGHEQDVEISGIPNNDKIQIL